MHPVILGLDVSLSCTGWAMLSLRENRLLHWGKVSTRATRKGAENDSEYYARVHEIVTQIDSQMRLHTDSMVVAVAVEQLNSFRGGDVSRRLIGASKILQYHLWKNWGLPCNEINTMTAKKAFTGNGHADKTLMLVLANTHYKISPPLVWVDKKKDKTGRSDEDIADATAMAHTLKIEIGADLLLALDKTTSLS